MNNSMVVLVIVALIAIAAVMGVMMYYLDELNRGPKGKELQARLSVATKHDLSNFKLSTSERPGGRVLLITYQTEKLLPSRDRILAEMNAVASDTWNELPAEARSPLTSAEVHREFTRSTGCFQNTSREKLTWTPPPDPKPRLGTPERPPILIPKQGK